MAEYELACARRRLAGETCRYRSVRSADANLECPDENLAIRFNRAVALRESDRTWAARRRDQSPHDLPGPAG
jgi:hypothetical protein